MGQVNWYRPDPDYFTEALEKGASGEHYVVIEVADGRRLCASVNALRRITGCHIEMGVTFPIVGDGDFTKRFTKPSEFKKWMREHAVKLRYPAKGRAKLTLELNRLPAR